MASGRCKDAFEAAMYCVAAAVEDGSTPTTQPLPCLDAADSLRKCMEENASKNAHTLVGEEEADANKDANRGLVLELMKLREGQLEVQKAADVIHLACDGMTTPLPLPCREAFASFQKCLDEHVPGYCRMLDRISAGAGDGEADA